MIGAEALVRWQHPDLGLVFPPSFIGLAEETGLIVPIGDWVLERVCKLGRQWRDKGLPSVCISVNLSARQFQQRNLVSRIAQILDQTGLDPTTWALRSPKAFAMKNADFTISALNELKKMGIHFSLDDFGTGYSSLSYLKRFPLETLKIDRSLSATSPPIQRRGHCAGRHCPGPFAQAQRRGRGRGDGRTAELPEGPWLRPGAGATISAIRCRRRIS